MQRRPNSIDMSRGAQRARNRSDSLAAFPRKLFYISRISRFPYHYPIGSRVRPVNAKQ
jgi:hypothetical protein